MGMAGVTLVVHDVQSSKPAKCGLDAPDPGRCMPGCHG